MVDNMKIKLVDLNISFHTDNHFSTSITHFCIDMISIYPDDQNGNQENQMKKKVEIRSLTCFIEETKLIDKDESFNKSSRELSTPFIIGSTGTKTKKKVAFFFKFFFFNKTFF